MTLVLIQFLVLAAIVVTGAVFLSKNAEIIEDNSMLNPTMMGVILAIATSLPELVTGITSLFLGKPEMAIGNVLGSNAFNYLIIAGLNIFFINKLIYTKIEKKANQINYYVLAIYFVFLGTLAVGFTNPLSLVLMGRITVSSVIILILYILAVKNSSTDEAKEPNVNADRQKLKKAVLHFVILAVIILVTSIYLAKTADKIVAMTGMSPSTVGAIFIGISTSLPELITCSVLVMSGNYTMGATGIFGSNLFNFMILIILDLLSSKPLLLQTESTLVGLIVLGMVFTVMFIISLTFKTKNKFLNILPSIVMFILYFFTFL